MTGLQAAVAKAYREHKGLVYRLALREWSLLVIDMAAPAPARPREEPAALDMNSLSAQLHELERNRR